WLELPGSWWGHDLVLYRSATGTPDGRAYPNGVPYAYVAGAKMEFEVTFRIVNNQLDLGTTIWIKGDGPGLYDVDPIEVKLVTKGAGANYRLRGSLNRKFAPATTQAYIPFVISWYWATSRDATSWHAVENESRGIIYVTHAKPQVAKLRHTVVNLGSVAAHGKDKVADIIEAVWAKFSTREVKRTDGQVLTYYKSYSASATTADELLKEGDGQCGSWSELFIQVLLAQGIGIPMKHLALLADVPSLLAAPGWPPGQTLPPAGRYGLLVKNWRFNNLGKGDPNRYDAVSTDPSYSRMAAGGGHDLVAGSELTDLNGIPGQGNDNPKSIFTNHQVVEIQLPGKPAPEWFDPSYGLRYTPRPGKTLGELFDEEAIAGYYADAVPLAGGPAYLVAIPNPPGNNIRKDVLATYP
ncbi:MAG: hypothetical protein QXS54_13190, partial [Candidatus Methanomethylicaceae archaeon]